MADPYPESVDGAASASFSGGGQQKERGGGLGSKR